MIHRYVIEIGSRSPGCLAVLGCLLPICLPVQGALYSAPSVCTLYKYVPCLLQGIIEIVTDKSSDKSRNHKCLHYLGTVFHNSCVSPSYYHAGALVRDCVYSVSVPSMHSVVVSHTRVISECGICGVLREIKYAWLPSTGISRMESSGRRI